MRVLVVVSKKATRHFAINIGLYDDLSEERSAAHQLKYIKLKTLIFKKGSLLENFQYIALS